MLNQANTKTLWAVYNNLSSLESANLNIQDFNLTVDLELGFSVIADSLTSIRIDSIDLQTIISFDTVDEFGSYLNDYCYYRTDDRDDGYIPSYVEPSDN